MSVAQTEAVPALAPVLPSLRLLPVPPAEPPYDDELPTGLRRLRTAPLQLAPAPLRLVPPLPGGEDDAWSRPCSPLADLAPVQPFAHAFVQRLLEVLAGLRPVAQLQRDTTPELFARLERHVAARPPSRGARTDQRAVRSVRVQARPEGVAEGCATIKRQTPDGPRASALAFRLEGLEGRWCCVELQGL